jgi:hypothetical protein
MKFSGPYVSAVEMPFATSAPFSYFYDVAQRNIWVIFSIRAQVGELIFKEKNMQATPLHFYHR